MDTTYTYAESEDDRRIETYRIEQFRKMGFSPVQVFSLLAWGTSMHDAEFLTSRGCEPARALTILEPLV